MIIDCIADLHGYYPPLEGGDLLIVSGDLTANDKPTQYIECASWLAKQEYKKIIMIAGNHDNRMQSWSVMKQGNCEYLCDSGTEFEGLKIWGSPWSLWFHGINPKCKAFTGSEEDLRKKWNLIPCGIDILITHGPPMDILDKVSRTQEHAGSLSLHHQVSVIQPRLHVFGHIHEGHGQMKLHGTTFVNASYVNERYEPVNKPIRVVL